MLDKKIRTIQISSSKREELIEITSSVSKYVASSGISDGLCYVYVPHTTAGVTINENADPDVRRDIILGLEEVVDSSLAYSHAEGNSPAHIKSSLVGNSLSVFIQDGKLVLGTWQGIYFCEFDGPRSRGVHVKIVEG